MQLILLLWNFSTCFFLLLQKIFVFFVAFSNSIWIAFSSFSCVVIGSRFRIRCSSMNFEIQWQRYDSWFNNELFWSVCFVFLFLLLRFVITIILKVNQFIYSDILLFKPCIHVYILIKDDCFRLFFSLLLLPPHYCCTAKMSLVCSKLT